MDNIPNLGYSVAMIIGVDEVGRGSWAGPVCVGAVGLGDVAVDGLADSKLLTASVRSELAVLIKRHAIYVGIGWASAAEVDEHGLTGALRIAGLQAIKDCDPTDTIILDGNFNYLQDARVTTVVKGDALHPEISAASIVAKVARDNYMTMLSYRFSVYGFERHVGYGTPAHRKALAEIGPSAVHRRRFAPIRLLEAQQNWDAA